MALKPLLYVSRLLPEPVMVAIRDRYELLREPTDAQATVSQLHEGLMQAEAAIVTLTDRIDTRAIDKTTRLKILANYAVGYNNIDLTAAHRKGLVVTNTPDVLTDATADLTWALILATARRLLEGDRLVRNGQWTGWAPTQLLGAAVAEQTLGIVGMGRIGQAVAQRAAGFRMKVLYYTHRPLHLQSLSAGWKRTTLSALLAQSDFVSMHVPLTSDTKHLIGASELLQMKRTAFLINTARGPIVDEAALVAALKSRRIAGAALDVYDQEPLPANHPLRGLDNVVITPHVGFVTEDAYRIYYRDTIEDVLAFLDGKPVRILED